MPSGCVRQLEDPRIMGPAENGLLAFLYLFLRLLLRPNSKPQANDILLQWFHSFGIKNTREGVKVLISLTDFKSQP